MWERGGGGVNPSPPAIKGTLLNLFCKHECSMFYKQVNFDLISIIKLLGHGGVNFLPSNQIVAMPYERLLKMYFR